MFFKDNENIFIQKCDNYDNIGITHCHNFIEILYVISGSAVIQMDGSNYVVKKGDLLLIDYKVPHFITFDPMSEDGFLTYNILFTPDFFHISTLESNDFYSLVSSYLFSSIFTDFSIENKPQNLLRKTPKEFLVLCEKMFDEYITQGKGFQNLLRAYLIELIIKMFREIDKQAPAFTETHQELVMKAISYMQENYTATINLDEVVSGIFLSKDYFRQIFKKTTGISISAYIQELRINEACRLLEETVYNSSQIAYECGFNDTKFFYQTFKRVMGMTPAEYRREKMTNPEPAISFLESENESDIN